MKYFSSIWSEIKTYFNVKDDLETQPVVEQSIRSGVTFRGSQLLTLIFAIFIASLGLNTNSIPVVIGAMLISPLMGPIIGMGLGIGIEDFQLVKRSLKNISAAVVGSLIASSIYFLISPQYEGSSQLLARTSPSIYDVFVALFGGAAGILSIAAKNKGQVLPGVAIATSLMPPLCTAGYGLATLQMNFFFGALYLFFTNMIFIFFATWIGVKVMNYKKAESSDDRLARRTRMIAYTVVGITIAFSSYLTVLMINKSVFQQKASNFVTEEMNFPNTQVLSHSEYIKGNKRYINVTLIGKALPKDSLQLAMMQKLDSVGLGGTILNIKQGFSMPSAGNISSMDNNEILSFMTKELDKRNYSIDSLKRELKLIRTSERISEETIKEMKILFPAVKDITVAPMIMTSLTGEPSDTLEMAFINAPKGIPTAEKAKLKQYLELKLKKTDLDVIYNPSYIPWQQRAQR